MGEGTGDPFPETQLERSCLELLRNTENRSEEIKYWQLSLESYLPTYCAGFRISP